MEELDVILELLCDPLTKEPLQPIFGGDGSLQLRNRNSHASYRQTDGIFSFVPEEVHGLNKKYQELYDRIAPVYNLANKAYHAIKWNGEKAYRNEFLRELEIEDGDRVIEISCGTGDNFHFIDGDVRLYGLDLSWGMLRACRRHLKAWRKEAVLFHGNAEDLPFRDNVFDVVFHVGGINFFNDRSKALREMVRVAKPGSKVMVVDENEEHVQNAYEKIPWMRRYFSGRSESVNGASIADLLPDNVADVRLKDICGRRLYCLTFRKIG
ncbi:class I SAM-dependent methyltransferase [Alicyclobacillus shizuokensis]|uniref:class I SAM-dependent methyltransferase n=1 Tax=Alicyclobacillus shizuokensis TaxID=392014 RepID=UPI000836FDE7|nr:methyltransferase domain-containing protein [Alicyclobacillus shizuokensis]MCL6626071.1 class I SAM-dependent methyltransferase [Alicyclobacillus shizuokensis]